jgi:hypothetical protein
VQRARREETRIFRGADVALVCGKSTDVTQMPLRTVALAFSREACGVQV